MTTISSPVYLVCADEIGAYVDSSYELGQTLTLQFIALFRNKTLAQAYVSFLNSQFHPDDLKHWNQ